MTNVGLVALGDQVQALCVASGLDLKAFVIFAADTAEYRTPYDKALLIQAMREAADALEQDG